MADLPKEPVTRQEMYLSRLAGENTTLPIEPVTREEMYLEGAIDRVEAVEQEVEEMKDNPDVVDIVATYADLQAYDTSKLTDKDVIRVLTDETHDGNSTYYRYSKSSGTFTYIGSSKQYSNFVGTDGTAAGQAGLVPAPATTDAGKVLGAGGTWVTGGPTVVQTTGTSTTDVMSQNAATSMIYADPSIMNRIRIGRDASSNIADNGIEIGHESGVLATNGIAIGTNATVKSFSSESIAIGTFADARSEMTEAIGYYSYASKEKAAALGARTSATHSFSVALGAGATTSAAGEVNIGTGILYPTKGYANSNYRLLTGLYDPQTAHDAATKGYVDSLVGDVAAALNAINNGTGA